MVAMTVVVRSLFKDISVPPVWVGAHKSEGSLDEETRPARMSVSGPPKFLINRISVNHLVINQRVLTHISDSMLVKEQVHLGKLSSNLSTLARLR